MIGFNFILLLLFFGFDGLELEIQQGQEIVI
jgi:hypothetical protein